MGAQEALGKLTFETETCGGCRTCELACSFHHRKVFQPGIASIEIKATPHKFGFTATLYKKKIEDHMACDQCRGLSVPMCIQFCPASLRDELENLLQRSTFGRPGERTQT